MFENGYTEFSLQLGRETTTSDSTQPDKTEEVVYDFGHVRRVAYLNSDADCVVLRTYAMMGGDVIEKLHEDVVTESDCRIALSLLKSPGDQKCAYCDGIEQLQFGGGDPFTCPFCHSAEFFPTSAKIELSDHTNSDGYSGDITSGERVNWADHSKAVIYGPDFEEILIWLNDIIQDGVGSMLISLTDDGDVGVWFPNPDDDKPIGTGGDVVEALHSAQHCWNERKEAAVIRHVAKSG